MARSLDGSVVAVVGATGVLGSAIAQVLTSRGATVVRAGRQGDVDVVVDLQDAGSGDALVAYARDRHGRLDGVVIAAGVVTFGPLADTDDEVIEELFLTNAIGPLWLARRVIPALIETRGFLVHLSGVVASQPVAGMAAYSASKAAVLSLTRFLAREWAAAGVRVNAITPGFFPAEQNRRLLFNADGSPTPRAQAILGHTPMGRFGDAPELVGAVVFLAVGTVKTYRGRRPTGHQPSAATPNHPSTITTSDGNTHDGS